MEQLIRRNKHHIEIIVMIAIFIVFLGIGMFLLTQKGFNSATPDKAMEKQEPVEEQSMTGEQQSGAMMKLQTMNGSTSYKVGDMVDVVVSGDSNGKDISGFDTLLSYDPAVFEVVQVKPVMKEFQVFTFKNPGYVSMTSTKLLTVQTPTVFTNAELIDVTLKAKAAGSTTVAIKANEGKEKTKMVDNEANIIMPGVGSLDLVIN